MKEKLSVLLPWIPTAPTTRTIKLRPNRAVRQPTITGLADPEPGAFDEAVP